MHGTLGLPRGQVRPASLPLATQGQGPTLRRRGPSSWRCTRSAGAPLCTSQTRSAGPSDSRTVSAAGTHAHCPDSSSAGGAAAAPCPQPPGHPLFHLTHTRRSNAAVRSPPQARLEVPGPTPGVFEAPLPPTVLRVPHPPQSSGPGGEAAASPAHGPRARGRALWLSACPALGLGSREPQAGAEVQARAPPHLCALREADPCPSRGLSFFVCEEVEGWTGWAVRREQAREHSAPALGPGSAPLPGSTCPSHFPVACRVLPFPTPSRPQILSRCAQREGPGWDQPLAGEENRPSQPRSRRGRHPEGEPPALPFVQRPEGRDAAAPTRGPRRAGSPRQLPGIGRDPSPPSPRPPPAPPTCCVPARRRAPPAKRALQTLRRAPRAPSIQVQPCARRRKFCCGFSPPRLSPARPPAPRASAGLWPSPDTGGGSP